MDEILNGITVETQRQEDGTYLARSGNFPDLNPAVGDNPREARQSFDRRLRAFVNLQMDAEKANAVDCSLNSKDPLAKG
jgi:hypothetical protein